jgi:hypothetical protein
MQSFFEQDRSWVLNEDFRLLVWRQTDTLAQILWNELLSFALWHYSNV